MTDVLLYQTDDGGEIDIDLGIVSLTDSFQTMAFLCLYGGNIDDDGSANSTSGWWGNVLETDDAKKMISRLQNLTRSIPLISGNLPRIEDAALQDLNVFLTENIASSVSVTASIPTINTLQLDIRIEADGEISEFSFVESWLNSPIGEVPDTTAKTISRNLVAVQGWNVNDLNDGPVTISDEGKTVQPTTSSQTPSLRSIVSHDAADGGQYYVRFSMTTPLASFPLNTFYTIMTGEAVRLVDRPFDISTSGGVFGVGNNGGALIWRGRTGSTNIWDVNLSGLVTQNTVVDILIDLDASSATLLLDGEEITGSAQTIPSNLTWFTNTYIQSQSDNFPILVTSDFNGGTIDLPANFKVWDDI